MKKIGRNDPCPCGSGKKSKHCCMHPDRPSSVVSQAESGMKTAHSLENRPSSQEVNALISLFAEERLAEAEILARRMTVQFPSHGFGWKALGAVLKQIGRNADALPIMQRAVVLLPNDADAYNNLGAVLHEMNHLREAEAAYLRALELKPDHAGYHFNLGYLLHKAKRYAEAEAAYLRAIELNPDFAEGHNNLGGVLKEMKRHAEAEAAYLRAIELKPNYAVAHNNMGLLLKEMKRFAEAEAAYLRVIELNPDFAEVHNNLGTLLKQTNRPHEAKTAYLRALEVKPDFAEAHLNLAFTLLKMGDLKTGWEEYEWRWLTAQISHRDFVQPQWKGEAAEGKMLLIHSEQGFGDTLQFCRYAQLAAARGLKVIMEVQPPLVRLLRGLPGVDLVIGTGEYLPTFDLHCPMLSLPLAFSTSLKTIPSAKAYLQANEVQVEAWRTRLDELPNKGFRIGLVWAGNPRSHIPHLNAVDQQRSMEPELLAPLFNLTEIHFFSLQKDGPHAPKNFFLTDFMNEVEDFADTAALIMNIDLVISVDTAVVHLAAALGKPVWVLDRFDSCWRWPQERQDSPWYPSLRLFRQPIPGDWQSVIENVVEELSCRHHVGMGAGVLYAESA